MSKERAALARIVDLATDALVIADQHGKFMLGAKREDALTCATEILLKSD